MEPKLVKAFEIRARVGAPTFIGQDGKSGRRQLIAITGGEIEGFALPFDGVVLPDGVDSQVVRPNGRAELSARYGVRREATFFAGISFITRLSSLTRSGVFLLLFAWFGFESGDNPGTIPGTAARCMMIVFPIILMAVSFTISLIVKFEKKKGS